MSLLFMPRHFQALLLQVACVLALCNACKDTNDSSSDDDAQNREAKDPEEQQGPSCDFGDDKDKCEGKANQLCSPLTHNSRTNNPSTSCEKHQDCTSGELCIEEPDGFTCRRIQGQCLYHCAGDFDCARDEYCHPRSGACQKDEVEGARFGSSCEDQKDCAGDCIFVSDALSECEETCRVGAKSGCSQEKLQGSSVSCAFFAYDLVLPEYDQGAGDVGICAHLCDSNTDCADDQLCLLAPTDGHAGICTGGIGIEESVKNLESDDSKGNSGGAGGAKN